MKNMITKFSSVFCLLSCFGLGCGTDESDSELISPTEGKGDNIIYLKHNDSCQADVNVARIGSISQQPQKQCGSNLRCTQVLYSNNPPHFSSSLIDENLCCLDNECAYKEVNVNRSFHSCVKADSPFQSDRWVCSMNNAQAEWKVAKSFVCSKDENQCVPGLNCVQALKKNALKMVNLSSESLCCNPDECAYLEEEPFRGTLHSCKKIGEFISGKHCELINNIPAWR